MSKKQSITERIRDYYCSWDNKNEWLVEKGKVKEGRLLKEACLEIERLEESYNKLNVIYYDLYSKDRFDRDKLIQPYQDKIYKLHHKLQNISEYIKSIEFKNKDTANIIQSMKNTIEKK